MRRIGVIVGIAVITALFAVESSAQVGKGLSGPHYNLNIIGVQKDKTADMTNTDGHTIFVPLQSGGDVSKQVGISFVAGTDFQVLDANGTDGNALLEVPSDPLGDVCYNVYAVGLGKPNGDAMINATCVFDTATVSGGTCTDALLLNSFTVKRPGKKPQRQDISDVFRATGCIDTDGSGTVTSGDLCFSNIWIFNVPNLVSYMWDYDNNGLKLMQVRFYPTTCGTIGVVP